jgi:hypothetical protein
MGNLLTSVKSCGVSVKKNTISLESSSNDRFSVFNNKTTKKVRLKWWPPRLTKGSTKTFHISIFK